MSDLCVRRLQRELKALKKDPMDGIDARPLDDNIRVWHYCIRGSAGTVYEGGYYHGTLEFPKDYPLKPPAIKILTPSGRFKEDRKLCFSFSDFHPESWNPMWSVSTILLGFYSFMLDTDTTLGSVDATTRTRRKFAAQSLEFNCRNKNFRECFPEYVELYEKELRNSAQHGGAPPASAESGGGAATAGGASSSGAAGTLQHGGKGGLAVDQQEPTAGMLMLSVSISLLLLAVILKLCT